jgi:crotonobetainyl-CoA:carnitine CoA-transferase CaiB-like acyl-CoA transferase
MVAGPYCGKLLADLGAEVIKIEKPGAGDQARRRGPFPNDVPDQEASGLFLYLNTNKLGITLDVKTCSGRAIFEDLVAQTDVLIEDWPPGCVEEAGLTHAHLREVNPRIVMTSITQYGQAGPYRDYKAHELNCVHAGGEGYMMPIESDYPDREPLKGGGLVGDCNCGLSACLATLAAAYRARATGLGQHVDVSKQDILMTLVGREVGMYTYSGVVRSRHRRAAITAVPLRCRDGYVHVSAFGDRDWRTLIGFMGRMDWANDEGFSNVTKRWSRADEINQGIENWVADQDKEYLFHELQKQAVAAVPVSSSEDLLNAPQLRARDFFVEIDHPRVGRLEYPSAAYRLSETPLRYARGAPLLGQHNDLVFCDRLGLTRESVVRLAEAGVV